MRSKSVAVLVAVVLLLTTPTSAQVEGIASSIGVASLVDSLTPSLQAILADAGDTFDSSAFVTRQQIQVLIWELQAMGDALVDNTFSELDQAQRQFFQDTHNMIEAWNAGNHESLKQVSGLLAQANDALGTIPGAHRKPRVTGFSPHFLDSRNRQALIRIKGSWLGLDEPTLALGEALCARHGKLESELTFACPIRFGLQRRPSERVATLTVFERQSFLESLTSWFGEPPSRTYEIPLTVMPPIAGSYRASFVAHGQTIEIRQRTQRFEHRNGHCESSRGKTWSFSPRSGWKIDVDTIRVSHDANDESSWQGVDQITEAGFRAKARVRNQGSCTPFSRDGRGKVWGTARWTEYRQVETAAEVPGPGGSLRWGHDTELELPPGVQSYAVTVDLIDGSRRILTSAEPHRWLRLIDESPDRLVLRVSDLSTALH